MRHHWSILFIFVLLLLLACRAHLETSKDTTRTRLEEIGVVLRHADSLSSTLAEKQNVKIEFYPPTYFDPSTNTTNPSSPADPTASSLGGNSPMGGIAVGMGAVKSIEFSTETNTGSTAVSKTDSVYQSKEDTKETLHKEADSGARQDNGTVTIVAVVFAVAALAYLFLRKKGLV